MPKNKSKISSTKKQGSTAGRSISYPNNKKNFTSKKSAKYKNSAQARTSMRLNAEAYVRSLYDPFNVRGVRIPDETPYPSTVGCSVMRFQPTQQPDSVNSDQYVGFALGADLTNDGAYTATISQIASGVETWTTSEHPHQATFASNFSLMRTVTQGLRFVDISKFVERGGALYICYSCIHPSVASIADMKLSDECEVYDYSRMQNEGITAVWLPLSRSPVQDFKDAMSPTGSTYVDPSLTLSNGLRDTWIYIWAHSTDSSSDITMEFEVCHNWEAIPFPANQFLFDRKAIVSDSTSMASAKALAAPAVSTGAANATGSVLGEIGKGLENVGKFALKQVEGLAMKGLTAIPSLIGNLFDLQKHQIAVHAKLAHLSPAHCKAARSMNIQEYMQFLNGKVVYKPREEKEDKFVRVPYRTSG
jgi:hypothetical protein